MGLPIANLFWRVVFPLDGSVLLIWTCPAPSLLEGFPFKGVCFFRFLLFATVG